MKRLIFMTAFILPISFVAEKSLAQVTNVGTVVSRDADNHANSDINSTINGNMDKAENKLKGIFKKKKKLSAADSAKNATSAAATTTNTTPTTAGAGPNQASAPATASFTSYQNYDFVPGEQIIFSDDFSSDQDGEFPAHWRLLKGQGVVNKVDGKPALLLSEDRLEIKPRMKAEHYLTDAFTLEFDFIFKKYKDAPGYSSDNAIFSRDIGLYFYFKDDGGDANSVPRFHYDFSFGTIFGRKKVTIGNFEKNYPDALLNNFTETWHHAAIIYKNGVMKVYVDQYRVCVDPNIDNPPLRFAFNNTEGYNNPQNAIVITNVKLANGGGMNMIGKKFTDAKIVTHGITFDVNKAIITPGSMGTLNGIVKIMQDNPEVKFEIGGHTDSDGGNDVNMKLSQARADAVRAQLIAMGIDGGRLTTKGYGSTKPIGDNATLEGKANNRRVEFVKL
jgi:OOP family OmpA-OmpF porin